MRTFEILGSGAFQIVDYKKALENLFEIGKEVICYKNFGELREKIDYYINNKKEREEIAKRGHKKAIKEHRFRDRVEIILNNVEEVL